MLVNASAAVLIPPFPHRIYILHAYILSPVMAMPWIMYLEPKI